MGDRVIVEVDMFNGFGGLFFGGYMFIGKVEGYGVVDEVVGVGFEVEFVVDFFYVVVVDVKVWIVVNIF